MEFGHIPPCTGMLSPGLRPLWLLRKMDCGFDGFAGQQWCWTQENSRTYPPNSPLQERKMLAEYVAKILASGGPLTAMDIPAFTVGQRVTTRVHGNTLVDGGHTRLPAMPAEKRMDHSASRCACFPRQQCTPFGRPERYIPLGFMRGCGTLQKIQDEVVLDFGNPIWNLPNGGCASTVFEEPWHAQVFAITVALNEAGVFQWTIGPTGLAPR